MGFLIEILCSGHIPLYSTSNISLQYKNYIIRLIHYLYFMFEFVLFQGCEKAVEKVADKELDTSIDDQNDAVTGE